MKLSVSRMLKSRATIRRLRLARSYYVYILSCKNNYLYTGYTVDLKRRLSQHSSGTGSKFTRSHVPIKLVYSELYRTKSEAMKREIAIKRLSHKKKLSLIGKKIDSKKTN